MRTIITGMIIVCILAGCATEFSYLNTVNRDNFEKFLPYKTDSTYALYVRQVVKVFDSASRLYIPRNDEVDSGKELIEIEYLLISHEQKKAIVINNIANSRKTFYNSEDKKADLGANTDKVKIDIWYFSQFRFGNMENERRIVFKNVENEGRDHIWVLETIGDGSVKLNAISVADNFGEDIRKTEQAFAFDVLFKKADNYTFVFKNNNVNKNKNTPAEFALANQTLYAAQKDGKWSVIFSFDEPVERHFKNVVFSDSRMYAAPVD